MKSLSRIFTNLFSTIENEFGIDNTKIFKKKVGIICDIDSDIIQFKKKCDEITNNGEIEQQIMIIENEVKNLFDRIKINMNKAEEINQQEGRI